MSFNKPEAVDFGRLSLERLPSVKARTGLSRSEIYRRIAEGEFPSPVKVGLRASAWNTTEIDEWIVERIATRELNSYLGRTRRVVA